jgi:3-deoxy-D-manno-octulosonic-acid transferase
MFLYFLYNLLSLIFSPVLFIVYLINALTRHNIIKGTWQRFGFIPKRKDAKDVPLFWLHAVSVGETIAARAVWPEIQKALPDWQMAHSTFTDTGMGEVTKGVENRGIIFYMPFDFFICVWMAFSRLRPRLLVLMETELWPNLLFMAKMYGCKLMVVNGRISDDTARDARMAISLYRWMTSRVDLFCMQSQEDATRIISLGASPDKVRVSGNVKFDQAMVSVTLGEEAILRNNLGLKRDEPVLLAGSTHPGEEEIVMQAYRIVKNNHPETRLVIAPRHITRGAEIEELIKAHGFSAVRKTKINDDFIVPPDAVLILDTIGELAKAYSMCTAAFVGGSLVNIGGHNILEPMGLGKPAIFGPHMNNFRDITELALNNGVGFKVENADDLAARWMEFLQNPDYCKKMADKTVEVISIHRGAAKRCADEAEKLVKM